MKSMAASIIQRAYRLATNGPILLRKLSNYFYTKLVNNPWLYERLRRIEMLRGKSPWSGPKPPPNPEWDIDFPSLLEPGAALPARITVIGPSNAKEKEDFQAACSELGITFTYIDKTTHDAIGKVRDSKPDMIFARPSHRTPNARQFSREIYDQLYETELRGRVTPAPFELRIYESKRELAYFLQEERIPHPKTRVFLNEGEALSFAKNCTLPQVFKTSVGASSSGVEVIKTRRRMVALTYQLFRSSHIRKGLSDYRGLDFGYAIFQEYITDVKEFRVIKMGESWFSYEKSKTESQTFLSGSGVRIFTPPSIELLNFCRDIAEKYNIFTTAFDVFEDTSGQYLINEIQTWFGNYGRPQLQIDNVPGRYIYDSTSGEWIFEPGFFNINGSINLRIVEHSNQLHKQNKEGKS